MEGTKLNLQASMQSLAEIFGSAEKMSEEISEAAIELAVTPLADSSDYPHVQKVLFILNEIKKAFTNH